MAAASAAVAIVATGWSVRHRGTRSAHPQKPGFSLAKLPLSFEPNQGQTDARVKYLSKGPGYRLFLTPTEAVLSLYRYDRPVQSQAKAMTPALDGTVKGAVVRIGLEGANADAQIDGEGKLPGRVNYLIGRDRTKWTRGVPTYRSVRYQSVYPGIDLVYHSSGQRQLEYDFMVSPNADPGVISMNVAGADRLSTSANGDLVIAVGGSSLIEHRPIAYQTVAGRRQLVDASFVVNGDTVGLHLGAYDRSRPVVIDPTLVYSTFLGGSDRDQATGLFVDGSGHIFVSGSTFSTNFPTTDGAFQTTLSGTEDAFVTKIDSKGTSLIFSTYFGGSGTTASTALAVDVNDIPTIVGQTTSEDLPTANPFQPALDGPSDGFIAQFNPDTGADLLFSSYLGGSSTDCVNAVAISSTTDIFVAGITASTDFPVPSFAFQTTYGGGTSDGFYAAINGSTHQLATSTFLGGDNADSANGIAVDNNGKVYMTGGTQSDNFPVSSGAFQTTLAGTENAFLTKIADTGDTLDFSTYLGGNGIDFGAGIALSADLVPAITGATTSDNFPTTDGAVQTTFGGVQDAFLTTFQTDGSALSYSTYLGGNQADVGAAVAFVSTFDDAVVVGSTASTNFPVVSPIQNSLSGSQDAFLTDINMAKNVIDSSTYFGGSSGTAGTSVFLNTDGTVAFMAGFTSSEDLSVTSDAFQKTYGGGETDAFVAEASFTQKEQQSQSSKSGPNLTTTAVGLILICVWIAGVMIRRRHIEV